MWGGEDEEQLEKSVNGVVVTVNNDIVAQAVATEHALKQMHDTD